MKKLFWSPLLVVCCLLASCGPSAKEKTLRTTLTGVNAAREALVAWDEAIQLEIARTASTRAEGEAQLAVHRTKRGRLVAAFETVYRLMAIAAMDVDKANLLPILIEARKIYAAIEELKR